MSALQHLSPDVLEVVRDVARQEDSFLLRVQGVPLRAFMGDVAPRVGPRAPFLSAAERHLLEHCREETAYLFELAQAFSTFYEAGSKDNSRKVVNDTNPPEVQASRLLLTDLTARTIRTALDLLGIRVVERM